MLIVPTSRAVLFLETDSLLPTTRIVIQALTVVKLEHRAESDTEGAKSSPESMSTLRHDRLEGRREFRLTRTFLRTSCPESVSSVAILASS